MVINLSTTTLSKPQEVFSKGLNFAPTLTSIPVPEIIASVECAEHKLKGDEAGDLRSKVGGALRRFGGNNRLKPNLSHQQMKALKKLKKNNDVVILPADKGNTTVVMDRNEYDVKMKELVETPTYKKLNKLQATRNYTRTTPRCRRPKS